MLLQTPPMGWNSWDCYGATVTEKALFNNARVAREKLLPYGWQYVVCDIQWAEARPIGMNYRPFTRLQMDPYGRLLPAPNRFPSGFKEIARQIHDMGLKFGIHIMRGVPRQAVYADAPVLGAGCTCRDIALANAECRWNTDMYGVNPDHPGAQAYYDSLFQLYADWGVDYVKADDLSRTDYNPADSYASRREVEMYRAAIRRCGREIALSLSPGPARADCADHLAQYVNLWRITDDLWDNWPSVKAMFPRFEMWQAHARPGAWPDADMLPLGVIRMWEGGEPTRLTRDEQVLLMSMWCLFRSPLMMGGELTRMDGFTESLLTNAEMLAFNQSPRPARQLRRDENSAVWLGENAHGEPGVGLFNLSDSAQTVCARAGECGLSEGESLRELWTGARAEAAGAEIRARLSPHACAVYVRAGGPA